MPKAALNQMLRRHASHGFVIHMHEGQRGFRNDPQHVHRGNAGRAYFLGDTAVLDARDDAVATPMAEPARHGFLQAPRFVVESPGIMLANVACDPAQDVATGRQR